ncbi:MAG: phosphopyruvate hydratase [Candidatus Heimdallarchaeota archaeon]|nr:phosphopyruvate hydratase [Candidatus Heimdallarchaeota archaeon]MCK4769205.1 phosphopyruvate hydratase [Candidatus Heimdallarchaeota archaeon]
MVEITKIIPREIIDSRGNPTVEVDVYTSKGFGRALVPSGASTGEHEAIELRDNNKRFHGKGVLKALENINKLIAPKVIGMEVTEQEAIDNIMLEIDGTKNKSKLGANAILGVSLAVCKAAASGLNLPVYKYLNKDARTLPVPMLNIINGGRHAGGSLNIQEFMIIPHGFRKFSDALRASCEVYQVLIENLKAFGPSSINLGDEGGFGSPVDTAPEALDMIVEAIGGAGYKTGAQISIGLDSAASEFFVNSLYEFDGKKFTSDEFIDYYVDLARQYPIITIEDPFEENDFESFAKLLVKLPKMSIVADDLTVTNHERIQMAIDQKAANYLLLKVNQIGTLTESIQAANLARENRWGINISHRSGETEDPFIADLSVALGAEKIKTGAPARGERTAKYNQLLRIEEQLGNKAIYLGSRR